MKGVFCLEGFWYGDHRDSTSVKPVLDLLNCYQGLPFLYHRCSTIQEFEYSISRWKTKAFHNKYPVLWLAFHGDPGKIVIGKDEISIIDLANLLQSKCERAIIYFGCCSTMKWDKQSLQSFMKTTKTLAVMGYKQDIEWLPSASFEIRLLSYFQEIAFTSDSITAVKQKLQKECSPMINNLKFIFEINDRQRFTPKRIKTIKGRA